MMAPVVPTIEPATMIPVMMTIPTTTAMMMMLEAVVMLEPAVATPMARSSGAVIRLPAWACRLRPDGV